MDCSPPGSSVHGFFQTRVLEWIAISFSGDLPDPGIEPGSPELQADSLPTELWRKPTKISISTSLIPNCHPLFLHSYKPYPLASASLVLLLSNAFSHLKARVIFLKCKRKKLTCLNLLSHYYCETSPSYLIWLARSSVTSPSFPYQPHLSSSSESSTPVDRIKWPEKWRQ